MTKVHTVKIMKILYRIRVILKTIEDLKFDFFQGNECRIVLSFENSLFINAIRKK